MIVKFCDRNNILPTKEDSDVSFVGQIQIAEFTLERKAGTAKQRGWESGKIKTEKTNSC